MENQENSKWYRVTPDRVTPDRGGRPKMDDEEKAVKRVQVRFTPQEYEQVLALKSKTRTRTMSDFIRAVCLYKPLWLKPDRSTYQENVLWLVREMRTDALRMGVTVNQAARHIISISNDERLREKAELIWAELARLDATLRAVMAAVRERGANPT